MTGLKKISGKECLKIICNKFEFQAVRQRGSHIVVKKETLSGKVGAVIPMHKELKIGTLKSILRQAQIPEEEFSKFL